MIEERNKNNIRHKRNTLKKVADFNPPLSVLTENFEYNPLQAK